MYDFTLKFLQYIQKKDFYIVPKKVSSLQLYAFAMQIRFEMGLRRDEKFLPLLFVERYLMKKFPDIVFHVISQSEWKKGESVHGYCLISEPASIFIREDVYLGAMKGNPRDLQTIAHEGAHLFLFFTVGLQAIEVEKYNDIKQFSQGDAEAQANMLVSFLFCPDEMIAKNSTITKLIKASGTLKNLAKKD